ncbi:MAG: antibiotic biosynthesis monooxygenase [Pirellulaceae bacterium]|nr:antibiotic biosynthesis monooxygenase [Pirellulaceae bacterium]
MADTTSKNQPVHCAATIRVRDGMEAEFEELLLQFVQRSLDYRGTTGVHLIRPVPGTESREYGILRSFISDEHRREFYDSELYQQYRRDTADLVEGEPFIRPLHGLEAFFRTGGNHMPPRWKMAVVTYLGVMPAVLFWSSTLKPLLSHYHWLLGVAFTNLAVVATLAWVLMPVLTKLFHRWLHTHSGNSAPVQKLI